MRESTITTLFRDHNQVRGCFELKLCKGPSIPFDAVKPHQLEALLAISSDKGLFHKLTDPPIFSKSKTRFNVKRPFDAMFLKYIPAYIVICRYIPRKPKLFLYITPEIWQWEQTQATRKSLTMNRAVEIAEHKLEV